MRAHAWGRALAWAAVTAMAVAASPGVDALDPTLAGLGDALALGLLAGAAAFGLVARRRLAVSDVIALPPRRLVARSLVLTAKSAQEEALWRALLLGLLVEPVGRIGALLGSTAAFAAAHVRRQGRSASTHLVTGATFGAAYLLTGRLWSAITAHATFNVMVGAGAMSEEDMAVSDNGGARRSGIASAASFDRRSMRDARPQSAEPVARLEGVVKSFGSARALDGVDVHLDAAEILALLGPNGAGKSTAVAILLGLRRPDRGEATLMGGDPREARRRRRVGAVLQDVSFPPGLRVRAAVELVLAHHPGTCTPEEVLASLGLEEQIDRDAAGLSGGQRRRLAVALALAGDPRVLFLDEPTAGMYAAGRRDLLARLVSFADTGGSVLLTTQRLDEVEQIASRVAVLTAGRIVLDATVPEMRAHGGFARVAFRAGTVPRLPGVVSVETRGDAHVVLVEDADVFIAELVRTGLAFHELEVSRARLEDAFVALTTRPP